MEKTQKRKTYDTRVKYLVRKNLLPQQYKVQINRSLISKWRKEPMEKYVGYELNDNLTEMYEMMKLVSENERIRKTLWAFYRISRTLRDIIGKEGYVSKLKQHKTQVVQTIQRTYKGVGIGRAIRLMGISAGTYRIWAKEEFFKCGHSISKLCNNNYPQQLTVREIRKIHRLLTDPKILHWPIISVCYYARRKEILKVHRHTWYKYARLMKIKRLRHKKIVRRYDEGLRAKRPNEKWHADITELELKNGITYYIYLVIDNFSKYILSWRISNRKCPLIRIETFEEAIEKTKKMGRKGKPLELIVDVGGENNNKKVQSFLKQQKPPIRKYVALQDIEYSNAIIEAVNKTVKYDYLFPKNIYDEKQLYKTMKWTVKDYNDVRPHGTLNGLTPKEAQRGKSYDPEFIKGLMQEVREERIKFNQGHTCFECPFGCKR